MNVKILKELIRYQKELALMNGVQLTSWEALGYGISSTTKKMLKWLATNPMTWVVAAGALAVIIDSKLNPSLEKSKEKLEETQSKLSEVNSQIDENINKIKELESLDSLSITDEEDLKRLKDENKELEIRQAYLERLEELDKQQVADSAKREYNQQYGSQSAGEKMSKGRQLSSDIAEYKYYQEKKKQAESIEDEIKAGKAQEKWNNKLAKTEEKLIESRQELQVFKDELMATGASSEELDSVNAQLKQIDDLLMISTDSGEKLKEELEEVADTANKIDVSLDSYKKASEGISSLATAYKELSDSEYISLEAISKIKEAVGDSFSDWDAYEKKLLTVKKGSDEFDKVLGDLTYAILENKLGVDGLVNADEDYVANLLKENGVLNANKVAKEMIAVATAKSKINMEDETDVIIDNVEEMYRSGAATKLATGEMLRLIVAEKIFNNEDLSMAGKVDDLETLAKAFGITTASAETAKKSIENVDKVRQNVLDGINSAADLVKVKKQAESDFKTYTKDILGNIDIEFGKLTDIDYGGNDKKKKDNETKETFDWIETKISRLQRKITNLGNAVSDTFKKWSTRNNSLKDEIKEITKLLEVQEKATKKYKKKADSVKLSSSYKKKVREGAIDIDTIKDDDLKEKIKKYQEYYNKYLESLDKEAEAKSKLNEKYRQQFDNIAGEYENKIEGWSNDIANLEKQVELSEAKGNQISGSSYNDIITQQKKLVNLEKSEYDDLLKKFNDGVKNKTLKKDSEEWYNLKSEISQVKQSWYDAQIALEDYLQAQREADWDIFDNKQQKKTDFISDNDFLLGLLGYEDMYDDNGNITKYGSSANALHTINYDTYIQQAKDYATELAKLDKQYANDKNDTYYLERRKELLDAQQSAIDGAKNERQAMIDLAREGYDTLLDSMQKVIDKRKEALNEIKSLYEYERQISEQTDEISVIQKQLIAYQGDDSEESQSTIQQLQESLKDAQENLEETQYDKYISDQQKMYDNIIDETQEWIDELFENEAALLQGIIDTVSTSTSTINSTLSTLATNIGYTLTNEQKNSIDVQKYSKDNLTSSQWSVIKENSHLKIDAILEEKNKAKTIYDAFKGSGKYKATSAQKDWLRKLFQQLGFAKGGIVGDAVKSIGEDGFALLRRGEGIIPVEMMPEWNKLIENLRPLNQMFDISKISSQIPDFTRNMQQNWDGDVVFQVQMYEVNDPQEFAKQIKEAYSNNTGNLRKMIQSDMFSTNSLGHRRYL